MKQLGLLIDLERCIGCKTCVVGCRNYHELIDPATATPGHMPYYIRVESRREGSFPDITVKSWVVPCQHCRKPPCANVCPVDAITKDAETGIVLIDRETCNGCGECIAACPYYVIQFDEKSAKAHKCDLCYERVVTGQIPVCAEVCMTDAITFGEYELLRQEAQNNGRGLVKKLTKQAVLYVEDQT